MLWPWEKSSHGLFAPVRPSPQRSFCLAPQSTARLNTRAPWLQLSPRRRQAPAYKFRPRLAALPKSTESTSPACTDQGRVGRFSPPTFQRPPNRESRPCPPQRPGMLKYQVRSDGSWLSEPHKAGPPCPISSWCGKWTPARSSKFADGWDQRLNRRAESSSPTLISWLRYWPAFW